MFRLIPGGCVLFEKMKDLVEGVCEGGVTVAKREVDSIIVAFCEPNWSIFFQEVVKFVKRFDHALMRRIGGVVGFALRVVEIVVGITVGIVRHHDFPRSTWLPLGLAPNGPTGGKAASLRNEYSNATPKLGLDVAQCEGHVA